jgi:predicted metalloprotease with PDZ domain
VSAIEGLVAWGSPAFTAGLEHGDVIVSANGMPFSARSSQAWKPGETVSLQVRRVDGRTAALRMTLAEDPHLEAVPIEATGREPTPAQRTFRQAWLGSRRGGN